MRRSGRAPRATLESVSPETRTSSPRASHPRWDPPKEPGFSSSAGKRVRQQSTSTSFFADAAAATGEPHGRRRSVSKKGGIENAEGDTPKVRDAERSCRGSER